MLSRDWRSLAVAAAAADQPSPRSAPAVEFKYVFIYMHNLNRLDTHKYRHGCARSYSHIFSKYELHALTLIGMPRCNILYIYNYRLLAGAEKLLQLLFI